jgi:signal transduction histidine kinase
MIAQISAWVVAFAVSFFLTGHILRPIKKMRTAARKIASGNFNERISVTSNDEIGQLAEAFNSMTDSLNELENMRSSFISDVSHELRTPMTIICGFIEGMQDGTIPPEQHGKYFDTVLSEVKRLSRLVNDLLEASRLEQGRVKLTKKNVDMNRLVAESVFSYEKQLTEKRIDVNLELDEEECFAFADKDSIKRVMINLIDNAIKFTPDGGEIFVSTERRDKKVYVSVRNSGEGIAKEDLKHIWERFYKTDKSRSVDKKGVGLGLHIVKTIISQHGGEIYAESEEGKYASFTFVLEEGSKQI